MSGTNPLKQRSDLADHPSVGDSYVGARLNVLRKLQNADGGWGYFPKKQSWLEPTVFGALALHGGPEADRAWALLAGWQQSDGSWRPSSAVQVSTGGTALCVTTAAIRGEYGDPFRKGVEWLVQTAGVESRLRNRILASIGLLKPDRNLSVKGWPWKPNTSSWVEPTSHALVALKKSASRVHSSDLRERIRLGEEQLMDVRCADGGWNYGSRAALDIDLPSYPETTALALVGLQGRNGLGPALDLGKRLLSETRSPLARAWLSIALRVNGAQIDAPSGDVSSDILITALEALGAPEGNHKLLQTAAAA